MPLLKPGRWAWNPIEIEPQYRRLSEGLQVLLPFWDDNPINNLAPRAPVSPSAGFTLEHAIVSRPLRVGPSGLEVATQSSPSGEYIRTVETVSNQSPLNKSFSLVWVGRPYSIIDGGIRGWDGTKQIWLDALGGLLRIAFQGDSGLAYGSNCLQTVTLGSVVTIVLSSDWEGTRTKAWTSLYKAATTDQRLPSLALNVADRQTPTAGQKLYMGVSVNSTAKNFHGGVSLYGWWNRALTDTEAARLAADPFGLIRRRIPIELYGTPAAAPSAPTRNAIIFVAAD